MAPPTDEELDAYYKNWCKDHPNHKDCEEYKKENKINENLLDTVQTIGDAIGVVDQTGITDVVNAGISAARGAAEKDKNKKKEFYKNAALRAVSAIPVVGDAAKTGIYGEKATTVATNPNVSSILNNPKFRDIAKKAGTMAKRSSIFDGK